MKKIFTKPFIVVTVFVYVGFKISSIIFSLLTGLSSLLGPWGFGIKPSQLGFAIWSVFSHNIYIIAAFFLAKNFTHVIVILYICRADDTPVSHPKKTYVIGRMMHQSVIHFKNKCTLFTDIISSYVFVINRKYI